ncbi:hypothetical protein A7K99_20020 [Tatumella citrea]|uniref:Glycosyl transferase n=1 Tax=Tatumella citrea TaxID=53336 RepID=A0A1Y0LDQ5_TATCI|nr:hypothetical protein A7K98_20035 [Tatumella citrea]ARU99839.1 hypothetical protein A7K99_20020 [Tatumella citrea]
MWKKIKYWNRQKNHLLRQLKLKLVRLLFDTASRRTALDLTRIKKVLILRDDNKIGDMIVSTGLFSQLHAAGICVDVVAGKDNAFIAEAMPQVNNILLYPRKTGKILKAAWQLRRRNYDMVIDFGDYLSPVYYSFISLINARHTLGFNKSAFYRYDLNIDAPALDEHVTCRYKRVLALFGLPSDHYQYQLAVPEAGQQKAMEFIHTLNSQQFVVINPFAAGNDRTLSHQQVVTLTNMIGEADSQLQVVVIGPPAPLAALQLPAPVIKNPIPSFWSAVVLVQHAKLIISPDTSWVHVACAYQTPLIALYKSKIIDGGLINNKVWAPNFQPSTQIITDKQSVAEIDPRDLSAALHKYLTPQAGSDQANEVYKDMTA